MTLAKDPGRMKLGEVIQELDILSDVKARETAGPDPYGNFGPEYIKDASDLKRRRLQLYSRLDIIHGQLEQGTRR